MLGFDALHLARAQFGFTLAFHIIFPAFSIGLASYLAVLEGLWLATKKRVYLDLFQYWLHIFALGFGMGVVSGVVMSYQFGTNWSAFSDRAGPVIGPLMGYEVLTAFFLEAGFLGIMLFGMKRVGPALHYTATCLVAAGTFTSAFWILSVNSWMQTPRGYSIAPDGRFLPADWLAIIFNPSFFVRLPHMLLASYLSVAFVVGAVGAFHLLRDQTNPAARTMFSMAMWMAVLVAPAQIVMGDIHGLNTLKYQPAKIAALEGDWESRTNAPEILFGFPDMQAERTRDAVEIPYLGSLILTHSLDGRVPGLKDFKPEDRPYSPLIFWTFRAMVGIGFLMAGIGLWSLAARWRGRLHEDRWLLRAAVGMAPSGFIAVICGWMTTEVGRQPYTVYGLMRTADSVSPIGLPGVAASFIAFLLVYALVFGAGTLFILRLMAEPPHPGEDGPPADLPIRTAGIVPGLAGATPGMMAPTALAYWLPLVWTGLLGFAVLAYVVLDGFDLGVGILFTVEHEYEERNVMVAAIAPMWDGNETWLVLGGGGLLAVFPLAYAIILPALYPTIIAMLLALIFRGVAFEFRFRARSRQGRFWWDLAFWFGSTLAAFSQGLTLGGLLQGIRVVGRAYAGGWWDWLDAFTLVCGVAVVIGYALLGACWLIWRTEGELQRRAARQATILGPVLLGLIALVSLWTPFLNHVYWHRWFVWPNILLTSPVPVLMAALAWLFWFGLRRRHHATPFLAVLGWFVLCFVGLAISLFPVMVPPSITLWQAAAPPSSQLFLLVGASVLVPVILAYTGFSYWIFRGKVGAGTTYH